MKAHNLLFICFLLVLGVEFDYSILSNTVNFRHYALILLAGLSAFIPILYKKQQRSLVITTPFVWMLIYYGYILLSLTWSKNTAETSTALVGIFVCTLFAYVASNYFDYKQLMSVLLKVIIFSAILSWIAFLVFGKYALNPEEFFRLKGIFNHAQRLSITLSLALLLLTVNKNLIRTKWYRYTIIAAFLLTIFLTKTRAFTTFIGFTIVLHYVYSRKNYYLLFGLICAGLFVFYFDLTTSLTSVYERNDQDVTELTGRSTLWALLIPLIQKKLILGYGYGVFKEQSIAVFSWYPTHAHNLWLHQLYETGLIGTIIFQFFLISATVVAWKHNKMYGYSYLLYILIFTFLCSITGLVMGGLVTPVYFVLLVCALCEGMRVKMAIKIPSQVPIQVLKPVTSHNAALV